MRLFFLINFLCFTLPVLASDLGNCFLLSGAKYNIDPQLLWSIAMTESGGKIGSVGVNYDKPLNELKANEKRRALSEDLGLMQVNDGWLPALKKYGITREKLLSDGCVNIEVGAWILAGAIAKYGQHWDAVGAYNAGCRKLSAADCQKLRLRYTKRVWQWYSRLVPVQTAEIAQYQPAPGIAVIEEETN